MIQESFTILCRHYKKVNHFIEAQDLLSPIIFTFGKLLYVTTRLYSPFMLESLVSGQMLFTTDASLFTSIELTTLGS